MHIWGEGIVSTEGPGLGSNWNDLHSWENSWQKEEMPALNESDEEEDVKKETNQNKMIKLK